MSVLDIQHAALTAALEKHDFVPIDEIPDYMPETVILYVLTMGVVVARRFEKGTQRITALREVVRTRDVEFKMTLDARGEVAEAMLIQQCTAMLKRLWDGGTERVAIILKASHGAKVGFYDRDVVVGMLRAAPDPEVGRIARSFAAAGPKEGVIHCVIDGWGGFVIRSMDMASFAAAKPMDRAQEDMLQGWIVACRDQQRALGMFEKCLDKIGPGTPVSEPLADLLALLRHQWASHDAILAQARLLNNAAIPMPNTPARARLLGTLLALTQATAERQRGGSLNIRGGGKA